MLPAGVYTARPIEQKTGKIDKTGSRYVAVLFEVVDGSYKGATVLWRSFFTEKAAEDTKTRLGWLGWDGTVVDGKFNGLTEPVSITVHHKDGKYVEVKWVNQLGSNKGGGRIAGVKDELSTDEMNDLALTIGATVVAKKPASGVPF